MLAPHLTPGIYRHFKGNLYQVYGVAQKVDSDELLVIYRPLYGNQELVARPYEEFVGTLFRDGKEYIRFVYIGPEGSSNPTAVPTCTCQPSSRK